MNLVADTLAERRIDQLVALHGAPARELRRDLAPDPLQAIPPPHR